MLSTVGCDEGFRGQDTSSSSALPIHDLSIGQQLSIADDSSLRFAAGKRNRRLALAGRLKDGWGRAGGLPLPEGVQRTIDGGRENGAQLRFGGSGHLLSNTRTLNVRPEFRGDVPEIHRAQPRNRQVDVHGRTIHETFSLCDVSVQLCVFSVHLCVTKLGASPDLPI